MVFDLVTTHPDTQKSLSLWRQNLKNAHVLLTSSVAGVRLGYLPIIELWYVMGQVKASLNPGNASNSIKK